MESTWTILGVFMMSKMRKERTLAYFERQLLVKIDSFCQAIHKVPYAQVEGGG